MNVNNNTPLKGNKPEQEETRERGKISPENREQEYAEDNDPSLREEELQENDLSEEEADAIEYYPEEEEE